MVNFAVAFFLLFVIGASFNIFIGTILTHAAFIDKFEGLAMIFICNN